MTGNELKKIRKAMKKTQPEFAALLGYARYQTVLEQERRGKRKITRELEWRVRALKLDKHLR